MASLTELDLGAWLAALVGVQDQKANFEEKAVRRHVEATHLVEAVAAHHQRNEADSLAQHLDVVNYPIDSCRTHTTLYVISPTLLLSSRY